MVKLVKYLSLCLVVILAFSSLLIVKSTDAQTIPKPSVPEFTVRYVDYSYDVPPTYGIDQFTGKQAIIKEGYQVENKSFEFTIRNQPFTSYVDSHENNIHLLYNLRFKGHFGTEWMYFPFLENGQGVRRYAAGLYQQFDPDLPASNSEYTVLLESIPILFYDIHDVDKRPSLGNQVDFQVQALIGYVSYPGDGFYSLAGQSSDWSNTQTIEITNGSISTTTSTSPTPAVPEFSWLIALPLFLSTILFGLMIRRKRTLRNV